MKEKVQLLSTKWIISFFLMICVFNLSAQNRWETKEKKYNNGVCILGVLDIESEKIVKAIPQGKKASIVHDPFFNSYLIIFEEGDGRKKFDLVPFEETPANGTIYISRKELDSEKKRDKYFIINELNKNGKLHVIMVDPVEINNKQHKLIFSFEDFD
jgi:hypothetical protein